MSPCGTIRELRSQTLLSIYVLLQCILIPTSRNDAAVEKAKSFSDTYKIKAVAYQVDGETLLYLLLIYAFAANMIHSLSS